MNTYTQADTHDRMAYDLRKKKITLNNRPPKLNSKKKLGWTDNQKKYTAPTVANNKQTLVKRGFKK